ncbi:acetyl-CoA synthetase-like protein [Aspergillus bertholletiae]|uniref:Acetyl-CoA synthetase-like protein n=1 Tax=Aspergillus bertholletiae TaxID=1226010 RepID=A0A5N7B729_9EURO|nr:acetyl-CoA synthetase-like protein [Aspergillus bertholletiae]
MGFWCPFPMAYIRGVHLAVAVTRLFANECRISLRIRQKRKSVESSSTPKPSNTRQKITRACDHCKEKKTRCTGTLPCTRCTRLSLPCEYNAAYSRGLPPDPLPAPASVAADYANQNHVLSPTYTNRSYSSQQSPRSYFRGATCSRQQPRNGAEISGRNSPDPVVTDFEGNYLGPASGVSFLNRVWSRLHQDEIGTVPGEFEKDLSPRSTSVFMFGDRPYSDDREAGFALPSIERARELVEIYFDFSMVTYRFLHRGTVEDWLEKVYESNISSLNPPTGPMVARTAIVLIIFARWYAASKYLLSLESGPPRLESVQARLGQCLYLLSSSRANECWYAFGTALQLVTALGLHRRCPTKLSKNGNAYLEREIRKRIFWSTYTLDKYLSVMFGRPRLIHEEDHDQELPDEVNDEDMSQDDVHRRIGSPDCMMIASVLHYRLGRILGEVSRQLYTINPRSREPPLEVAVRLTAELEEWKRTAPPLFNSVLQLAYSHSIIHATRLFLLNDFTDLNRRPPLSHFTITSHVHKCVLIRSFWFTHYPSSYPDASRSMEDKNYLCSLFNLAEACQQHLAEATRKNCPSRRYGIILGELRLEARKQTGSYLCPDGLANTSQQILTTDPQDQISTVQRNANQTNMPQPPPLASRAANNPGTFATPDTVEEAFDFSEDFGLLENLEGLNWWTQLDAWPISKDASLHHDPSRVPLTVDELVRSRASVGSEQPVICYPRTGINYVDYPLRQLDIFAFRVAGAIAAQVPPRASSNQTPTVVSLLGTSDLSYLVMLLAVAKLGHTGLLLSTRISIEAYVSLLERTNSRHIFILESLKATAEELKERLPDLQVEVIPAQESFDYPIPDGVIDTNLVPWLDPVAESKHLAWIIHSSGSTGLPKPIYQTQAAAVKNYSGHMNMSGFITLPLYHNHGISVLFRTIYSSKRLYLYNAELPLTRQYLLEIMQAYPLEIFYGVPYALKLLAETEEGIAALVQFKAVMFGGSACPDSLGNLLVENNVNLISHYGSTETGQLMTSFRPREDKGWDYLRPSEAVKKYLRFEERYPGIFELVCLDGWPSKVTSNRPDGSYATKDLFVKHPTLEAYKYYARLDDTIVLVNGEKVNPLDMEGRVRQLNTISEAIVFGAGKACIGLAVVRASGTASMSDQELVESIWPAVEKAHEAMPAYGQLSKSMVRVLPEDIPYPRTDKGTIIRQRFYKEFSNLIEEAYEAEDVMSGSLVLSETELKVLLKDQLRDILASRKEDDLTEDADFFTLGMDSLQATQLRSILMKTISTNGQKLGLNVAFEHPTIRSLARYLDSLSSGATADVQSVEDQMAELISKYSDFQHHVPMPNGLDGRYIVITGATGSLGAHVVRKLSINPEVQKIYCLVRASSPIEAYGRVLQSMRGRRVFDGLTDTAKQKIVALPSNLAQPTLGLDTMTYNTLTSEITDIIHCAWSVNFNMHLSSFEKDNIGGLKHLLDLCIKAQRPAPASFNFCSSVSSVVGTAEDDIPEALPKKLSYAQNMGYAQSKLVGEHICMNAAQQAGVCARVLRIGQVIGDQDHGVWNATEAIPLMLQTATTIGALPKLNELPLWLPVDTVAGTVIDISLSSTVASKLDAELVFNIVSHHPFHWTKDLLPYIRNAGLEFEELEQQDWIRRLRTSNPDPVANPPIKLVDFFASKYDTDQPRRSFNWHTERARGVSATLADARPLDQELVGKMIGYFRKERWPLEK